MKKMLLLCSLLVTLFTFSAQAQFGQGGDTTGRAQRMKEMRDRQKVGLMDKAKLTDDEAEKVLDAFYANRMGGMRGMRDLSADERQKKMAELQVELDKKYKAIPLSDEKITAVNDYFASQQRNRGNGGPRPQQQ